MPLPWRPPPLPGRQPHRHMAAAEAEPPLLPPPEPPSRRSLRARATLPRLVPGPTHLPWPPRPGTPTPRHTALGAITPPLLPPPEPPSRRSLRTRATLPRSVPGPTHLPWPPRPGTPTLRHTALGAITPPPLPPPEPPSRRSLRTRATLPRSVPGPTHLPWPPRPGTPTPRHTALGAIAAPPLPPPEPPPLDTPPAPATIRRPVPKPRRFPSRPRQGMPSLRHTASPEAALPPLPLPDFAQGRGSRAPPRVRRPVPEPTPESRPPRPETRPRRHMAPRAITPPPPPPPQPPPGP